LTDSLTYEELSAAERERIRNEPSGGIGVTDPALQLNVPEGAVLLDGKLYRRDAKGGFVPDELVKTTHKLEDETVRKAFSFAEELSAQMARFRAHTFDEVDALLSVLAQEYKDHRGGQKGNVTLTTFDGLLKVQVAVADHISFGPELQTAKSLVDQCLNEWAADARAEIRAIIQRAFDVDQEGKVNRNELLSLLRLDIADERWQQAMKAIRDSMRIVGSKRYVRFYRRAKTTEAWKPVSLDMAAV
jgi:hypothetical protein